VDIKEYIQSGVIESYVLGLASAEEVIELEKLSMQYVEVRDAIDAFSQLIMRQLSEDAVVPPAEIKQQLLDKLADEFEQPKTPVLPINNLTAIPGEKTSGKVIKMVSLKVWRNVAAAAILLLLVSAALNFYYYNNYKQSTTKYQALLAERNTLQASNDDYHQTLNIIHDSTMHIVRMPGVPGKQDNMATLYWDTKTKDVYVYANTLQQIPKGKQYQLWALVDGKPVDAGVIANCNGICKMKNIPRAQAFAITLEKEGGSPSPTLTAMYVFGKV